MKTLADLLRASLWARTLTPAQLARVEAETLVRDLPVGVPVCRKGEPVEHWIGLVDGLVKMTSVTPGGQDHHVHRRDQRRLVRRGLAPQGPHAQVRRR